MYSSVRTSDFNSFNNNNNGPLSKMRTGANKKQEPVAPPVVNAIPLEVKQAQAQNAIRGEFLTLDSVRIKGSDSKE